ncbi:MAG: SDR family NAD(P)-dependent oxidoreductase [Flavobacteriaceae bacterium]
MTKVAILGCGWLGLPLAKTLLKNDCIVNGSTTTAGKTKTLSALGINVFQINLEQQSSNLDAFLNVEELIITIPPKAENYAQLIADLIPKIKASTIKRVTYTSSISVYGNASGIITEETDTNPLRESVKQIIEVEQLLLNNKSFSTNIFRLGGLIGAGRHPAYHISGKQLKTSNDLINLIHLEDCIAVIKQLLKTSTTNNIFNIVNPYHPSKATYYTTCCQFLKLPPPIITDNSKSNLKEVSSEKISTLLNYQFKNNLILS